MSSIQSIVARSAITALVAFVFLLNPLEGQAPKVEDQAPKAMSDQDIRQALIQRSIQSYSGSCPCPYSKDRAGRRCGKRSAHSRPGGTSPLCYERDVSQRMVDEYRKKQNIPRA